VCAVVVTYNPDESLERNLAALRPQVGGLVMVDNGSRAEVQPVLDRLTLEYSCILIRNPENYGIARALNQGIHNAEEQGFGWIAMFDQDSTVEGCYIEKMLRADEESSNPGEIAAVAPQYIDRESGKKIKSMRSGNGDLVFTMTSGSLVRIDTFHRVGYHDEGFFIDYVDIEWCLRARRLGMRIVESKDAKLLHSLGNLRYCRFLFYRDIPVLNHSVARCYYQERNRWHIYLTGKYDWTWLRHDLYYNVTTLVSILLWEDDRWRKVKIIVRAVNDALHGRMGKNKNLEL
jgi:rhamnosyltransferase